MASILDKIVEQTSKDLKKRKQKVSYHDFRSFEDYERDRRAFANALRNDDIAIIAEIKKASPSKGEIRPDFDPQRIAVQYREGGASAISVLTDAPFFKGHLEYLQIASREVDIPILRKDFIIDPYQVEEARAYGADAVLLIATITDGHQLQELHHAVDEAGLQALVECYNEEELQLLDFDQVKVAGVNNRDLRKFEVDLHRGVSILQQVPDSVVRVSESGLSSGKDLKFLFENDIQAALIGEHFMRQENPGDGVCQLREEFLELMEMEA